MCPALVGKVEIVGSKEPGLGPRRDPQNDIDRRVHGCARQLPVNFEQQACRPTLLPQHHIVRTRHGVLYRNDGHMVVPVFVQIEAASTVAQLLLKRLERRTLWPNTMTVGTPSHPFPQLILLNLVIRSPPLSLGGKFLGSSWNLQYFSLPHVHFSLQRQCGKCHMFSNQKKKKRISHCPGH